jgi:glycosyltransferase involved in cell wall biosynthesis
MLAALAAIFLLGRQKLVVHWHSDVVGKGWLGRIMTPLKKAALRRADSVDVTEVSDKSCVLPSALEKQLQGLRLVFSLGRLVPYKGFDVLVCAAKALPPDVVVVIVGTGQLHADLQLQVDTNGLSDKVILAGYQDHATIQALYQRAELFCLPSVERSEAFGVVLIEAMSHGLPVVATQIKGSGVPWVNAHGISGLNVPVCDAEALANACNQILLSDDLRNRLSKGARKRYEQEFTEDASVGRMLRLYKKLLSK